MLHSCVANLGQNISCINEKQVVSAIQHIHLHTKKAKKVVKEQQLPSRACVYRFDSPSADARASKRSPKKQGNSRN